MAKFPYDEQECDIDLGPLGTSDDVFDVEPSLGFDMQYFTQSNEYDVISTKTEKTALQVGDESSNNADGLTH